MFNREIFRKEAMDKLTSPSDLDELLKVNTKYSWILLGSLVSLILIALGWGIFGRIANTVHLQGIILPRNNSMPVVATVAGHVRQVSHRTGDWLRENQSIAGMVTLEGGKPFEIAAPCEGELVELGIKEGDLVFPGSLVARIGLPDRDPASRPEFLFFVPAGIRSRLTAGQPVMIPLAGKGSRHPEVTVWITYIGRIPVSDEFIRKVVMDEDFASVLTRGLFYLITAVYIPIPGEEARHGKIAWNELHGHILSGEAVTSRKSPVSYLLDSSSDE